ncbi:MAG: flagellar hook-length control protein FliK [Planctomycetaceae bacterium]|nr:flagellar hook-length control protein FliK [Planctomycetaceae bacterium]
MNITYTGQSTVDVAGNSTVNRQDDKEQEQNDLFARYLTVLKSSQLTELQQKELQKVSALDERNKILEQADEKKEDDIANAKREESKGNGYTASEMRRGLDLLDQSDKGKGPLSGDRMQETGQKSQIALLNSGQNARAGWGGLSGTPGALVMPENTVSGTTLPKNAVSKDALPGMTAAQVLKESLNAAAVQTDMRQQNRQNGFTVSDTINGDAVNRKQNGNAAGADRESPTGRNATDAGRANAKTAEMLLNGRSSGGSMAGLMAGMTQIGKNESAKIRDELDAKTASVLNKVGESKEKKRDTLTKEALAETSNAQQAPAHDTARQQANRHGTDQDVAVSQTLPNTSLMERVDQAQLTQRVASVFRSFANQGGTIRMKLHPEELGALTVRMQIDHGKVAAKLEAESETAKKILLDNVETLKQKLKDQNLEVTSFEIDVLPKSETDSQTEAVSKNDRQTKSTRPVQRRSPESDHVDVVG